MRRRRQIFCLVSGILVAGILSAWIGIRVMRGTRAASAQVSRSDRTRHVRLVSRTIRFENGRRQFPEKFAELQSPSARKTVPYLVVAEQPVSKLVRARATDCGARVAGFVPDNAMLVEAGEDALRKLKADEAFAAVCEFDPKDKIQARLRRMISKPGVRADVTIVPLETEDVDGLEVFVRTNGGEIIAACDGRDVLRARVPGNLVGELSVRGDVCWIEPFKHATLQNNVAVNPGLMNVRPVWNRHGLTGRGQNITTVDSGLDTGNTDTIMADFKGRVYKISTAGSSCYRYDADGHGTHTAGSIVGNGALSDGEITGVAPGARLYVWQAMDARGVLWVPSNDKLYQPDPENFPAYIASCSWGYNAWAEYTSQCVSADDYAWRHPENLGVFAAGNSGYWNWGTILDPAGAKNVIAVGATESLRPDVLLYASCADNPSAVWRYADNGNRYASSHGPMEDGRIKPDLCAPGTMILSTRTTQVAQSEPLGWGEYAGNPNYFYNSGTSMSTPLVAGAAALVREWLVDRRGFGHPTAALVKAVLTGGAYDMNADAQADCGGAAPNSRQGWGRVDLEETLFPSNRMAVCVDRIPFAADSDYVLTVTATKAAPLDVQLVWIDHPGMTYAERALVNDLDLVVSNKTTGVVWFGNGVKGGDRINNVESVRIATAAPGKYEIHVKGVTVPYDSTEGGAAALYVRGAVSDPGGAVSDPGGAVSDSRGTVIVIL